jgi:hypothetical protein
MSQEVSGLIAHWISFDQDKYDAVKPAKFSSTNIYRFTSTRQVNFVTFVIKKNGIILWESSMERHCVIGTTSARIMSIKITSWDPNENKSEVMMNK